MRKNKCLLPSKFNSGQIALIILTVMATALTWGLSMSRRVLTDLKISEQNQESIKAFSAAEAGIEETLRVIRSGSAPETINTSNLAADLGVDQMTIESHTVGGDNQFAYPQTFKPGETLIVWLRDHDANGNFSEATGYGGATIDLCWQTNAAVEAVYFYNSGSGYAINRFAFDPVQARRDTTGGDGTGNHFSDVASGGCAGLDRRATINLAGGTPLFIVVRPLYQETRIGVSGVSPIPIQGHEVVSTGEITQNVDEKISRRVRAFRSWGAPLPVIFHSVFSGNSISGN